MESHEEAEARRERLRRLNGLTAGLPSKMRARVRALGRERYSATETLEEAWAALHALREHYTVEYLQQCERASQYAEQAVELQREAAELDPGPERMMLEQRAAMMRHAARVDHARAAQVIAQVVDAERKCQDSLAEHRPSGYTRVQLELFVHGEEREAGDNFIRHSSPFDEELAAE